MKKNILVLFVLMSLALGTRLHAAAKQPNIVLIMCDDMGSLILAATAVRLERRT